MCTYRGEGARLCGTYTWRRKVKKNHSCVNHYTVCVSRIGGMIGMMGMDWIEDLMCSKEEPKGVDLAPTGVLPSEDERGTEFQHVFEP